MSDIEAEARARSKLIATEIGKKAAAYPSGYPEVTKIELIIWQVSESIFGRKHEHTAGAYLR